MLLVHEIYTSIQTVHGGLFQRSTGSIGIGLSVKGTPASCELSLKPRQNAAMRHIAKQSSRRRPRMRGTSSTYIDNSIFTRPTVPIHMLYHIINTSSFQVLFPVCPEMNTSFSIFSFPPPSDSHLYFPFMSFLCSYFPLLTFPILV